MLLTNDSDRPPLTINALYKGAAGTSVGGIEVPEGVLIKSGLKLSQEEESNMVDTTLYRMGEVQDELGIVSDGTTSAQGFMWYRENFQRQWDNDWRWREKLGGIFEFSNWSMNISKRFAKLLHAKASDDLLGTDPFFSAINRKSRDAKLAKQAEWFLQGKISQSNFRSSCDEGMLGALIRGESPLKVAYECRQSMFEGPAEVAVMPDGQPLKTPKGNFIFRKDDIIPDPYVQGVFRLKKEPAFIVPVELRFRYFESLPQTTVEYEGVCVNQVFYKDYGCPLRAERNDLADIEFHNFDEDWEVLKARYANLPGSSRYFNQEYQAAKNQPNEKRGEDFAAAGRDRKIVNCVDVYRRMEIRPGQYANVWMVLDKTNRKAIWYDYLENHMKRRPFGIIHGLEKVEGRWYGVGVFEALDHKSMFVDTTWNRINWKSSKASSMRFINKSAVKQWRAGIQPVVGDDQFFEIDDPLFNKEMPPAFEVRFGEIDPLARDLLEMQIQSAATEVGVMGPNDGELAGLDSTKLATGIRAIERTGNQLMKVIEKTQSKDIQNLLQLASDTVFENMDDEEIVYDVDTDTLVELNREEVRRIDRDIKLTLSRTRSTETLENSTQVINLVNQYYDLIATDPYRAQKLRPEYIRQLKALEVQDADDLLDEVTDEEIEQWRQSQAEAASVGEQKPPGRSISGKIGPLAPSERAQVLEQQGIVPAPPEEIAEMEEREAQREAEKKQRQLSPNGRESTNGNQADRR